MSALKHIYFSLENDDGAQSAPPPTIASQPLKVATVTQQHGGSGASSISEAASSPLSAPSCAGLAPDSSSLSTNSSPLTPTAPSVEPSANLNPSAETFVPAAPKPFNARRPLAFEMRASPGKGYGLFATCPISVGTRIIREKALLATYPHDLAAAYHNYTRLSAEDKAKYDALSSHFPPDIDFEQAARACLLRSKYKVLSPAEHDAVEAETIRVMGIFAANNFILHDGGQGVFETASRINHSCVPNVHHANNPNIRRETVHAMRDIEAGEELLANYLGAEATYQPRQARSQALSMNHGFICQCQACLDPTSDQRRLEIGGVFWGLNEYIYHSYADHPCIPQNPMAALAQAEYGIGLMLEEGILNTELCRAYRIASTMALDLQLYEKAAEYAQNEREVEANIIGTEGRNFVREGGVAAKQWDESVRAAAASASATAKPKSTRKANNKKKKKQQQQAARERVPAESEAQHGPASEDD